MPNVVIIKYNAGNVMSVMYALDRIGASYELSDDPHTIQSADKIIFPGVGEASTAMRSLRETGLDTLIPTLKQPFLGTCVGMQLLCNYSEEGDTPGLGLLKGEVKRFESEKMVEGPSFFISKTEVTNAEYRQFVESCIAKWMKENRPEIVQKYKWESPEYVQAVQGWLASNQGTSAADGAIQSAPLQSPAANWGELYL